MPNRMPPGVWNTASPALTTVQGLRNCEQHPEPRGSR